MAHIFLGWPNRINLATLSGGSWSTSLPVSNLAIARMPVVARSTDAANASTLFYADLGASYPLRALCLQNHNLSADARIRLSLGTDPESDDVYAGEWTDAYAIAFGNGSDEWQAYSWSEAVDSDEWIGSPFSVILFLPEGLEARYVTVEIDDEDNPAGMVQIGRAFVGNGYYPRFNAAYGLQDGFVENSLLTELESGAVLSHPRRRLRTARFAFELIAQQNEFGIVHELMRRVGQVGEVLYVPNYADHAATQRTGFIGRLARLNPIEYPSFRRRTVAFEVAELL